MSAPENISDRPSVWTLIEEDRFVEACSVADSEPNNTLAMRNKTMALFHLGKYQDVVELSEKLILLRNGETDSDFLHLGIAYWALNRTDEAIDIWQQSERCMYKDAAGGIDSQILLYFAGVKIKNEKLRIDASKKIKKLLRSKRSINYPGPLGHYLLDEMSEEELVQYVAQVPILRERQLCQAFFVSAIKSLEFGQIGDYYSGLKKCISFGSKAYLEDTFYLAKIELEKDANEVRSTKKSFWSTIFK